MTISLFEWIWKGYLYGISGSVTYQSIRLTLSIPEPSVPSPRLAAVPRYRHSKRRSLIDSFLAQSPPVTDISTTKGRRETWEGSMNAEEADESSDVFSLAIALCYGMLRGYTDKFQVADYLFLVCCFCMNCIIHLPNVLWIKQRGYSITMGSYGHVKAQHSMVGRSLWGRTRTVR